MIDRYTGRPIALQLRTQLIGIGLMADASNGGRGHFRLVIVVLLALLLPLQRSYVVCQQTATKKVGFSSSDDEVKRPASLLIISILYTVCKT
jgi:hypothetical protein